MKMDSHRLVSYYLSHPLPFKYKRLSLPNHRTIAKSIISFFEWMLKSFSSYLNRKISTAIHHNIHSHFAAAAAADAAVVAIAKFNDDSNFISWRRESSFKRNITYISANVVVHWVAAHICANNRWLSKLILWSLESIHHLKLANAMIKTELLSTRGPKHAPIIICNHKLNHQSDGL